MAARRKYLVARGALVGLLLALSVVVAMPSPLSSAQARSAPFLWGRSFGYGWILDIQGSRGKFYTGNLTWTVEYIFRTRGLDGSAHALWFLGRRPESFCLLFISTNDAGNTFFVEYYNYSENRYRADSFGGSYDIRGIRADPTPMPGYSPESPIPPFNGPAFEISSPYARITSEGGEVATPELKLQVHPLYMGIVTTSWQEIWALGLDEPARHPYLLIFYTTGPSTWIIDLWNGQVQSEPLGQVRFL